MPTTNVSLEQAGSRVEDVMLRGPRTLSPASTVAEARRAFENPRERLLLIARDGMFVGALAREALAPDLADDTPLGRLTPDGQSIAPSAPVADALALLEADASERLPVVEPDGTLVGLVCFNRRQGHFCVDARER
jgi:CBS domain-containing protein